MSSTRELVRAASKELGIGRNEAELVVATLMNRPRFEIYLRDVIDENDRVILWSRIEQLKSGMPIEYVTKRVQFHDYTLNIQPGVFIPRIETEYFVELIPRVLPQSPDRILEIGTGCGAISIALAHLYADAKIIATDISELAIANAVQNVRAYDLESRINLLRCDVFEGIKGEFDLIVSNPPYVPSNRMKLLPKSVREFEPLEAIDGGLQGVQFVEKLIEEGLRKELNPEFVETVTRSPAVYRGWPFQIECGIAFGGSIQTPKVMRFANRVPLLYQSGTCAITKAVQETEWRRYHLNINKTIDEPVVFFIHMASVWVPFVSESKEAVANYPIIVK